ncbi:hypothetical protein KC340_g6406 [Hortaea werneckii]|nr:hypothetical protein KC342_g6693 [Hortaea werneckii]KAI7098556.1 hypothetical protein KC339_g8883 [Hortaea werneckii]KAI7240684.1 hypothetical protein KC365_g3731 [Hortaea werneckii]KAI7324401.1 hypothetical protein KC340_g6406 [Hortaea werneckii]KAI7399878.1 hypothetical protein KC328_g3830 [Hortaea werneckii]
MSDHNNTSASQGQPAPAPASDAPNLEDTSPEVFLQAAHTAAGALCEIYRIILRVDSFENATQADMDVVHHEIWGILQGVNTPIDGLPADAQEDLRRVLRRASVLPGVRRFAPALGITARPGLDDSVTVPVGLIPGWDYPVQPGRPHLSQAEADVRNRDRQERRRNQADQARRDREDARVSERDLARHRRRRNRSDQHRLAEEEQAEDIAELTEMFLGQQVQLTDAGRDHLRQLGYRVTSDGIVWVRRLDEDELGMPRLVRLWL